jgi:hypothetical protein
VIFFAPSISNIDALVHRHIDDGTKEIAYYIKAWQVAGKLKRTGTHGGSHAVRFPCAFLSILHISRGVYLLNIPS